MTPENYSYLLSIVECDEDDLVDMFPEGETLNRLLQKRAEIRTQLAELYTFYTLNK